MKKIWFLIVALLLIVAGCGTSTNNESGQGNTGQDNAEQDESVEGFPQVSNSEENVRIVEIETSAGTIEVKLFPEAAPKAVENFVTHAEDGYYEGIIFHRVIKDFMIQTGDPQGTGTGGESIWGEPFEDELNPNMIHIKGALSMANSGPSTNGSQFFIVQASEVPDSMITDMEKAGFPEENIELYKQYGGTPWLDNKHTVFGQVTKGIDIVDAIADVEVDGSAKPLEEIVIKKMTVVK